MNTLTSCHLPSFTHIGTIMKDYRLQLCGSWDSNVILPFGRMIDYFGPNGNISTTIGQIATEISIHGPQRMANRLCWSPDFSRATMNLKFFSVSDFSEMSQQHLDRLQWNLVQTSVLPSGVRVQLTCWSPSGPNWAFDQIPELILISLMLSAK